jgi:hypothetical protein
MARLSNSNLEEGGALCERKWEYSLMGDGVAGQYCGIRRFHPDEKASRSIHSGDCVTDRKLWLWKPLRYQRGREPDLGIDADSDSINNKFAV